MIPVKFSTLNIPGKTPTQAAEAYFLSQYPETNNCGELNSQIKQIEKDIVDTRKKMSNSLWIQIDRLGNAYALPYLNVCLSKLAVKKSKLTTCSTTAIVAQDNPFGALNSQITSPSLPSQSAGSTTTNVPANSTAPSSSSASTNVSTAPLLVSDLTNPNQTPIVSTAPKNPNAPSGTDTIAIPTASGTIESDMTKYFSTKNILIGMGVLIVVGIIGFALKSKNKK